MAVLGAQNVCELASGLFINKDVKVSIDTDPCGTTPGTKYALLNQNILSISDESSETVEEYSYFSGDESEVASVSLSYAIEGHTNYGDPAIKYVVDMQHLAGTKRLTNAKIEFPWGSVYEGVVTLSDITVIGGDAGARLDFAFTMTFMMSTLKYTAPVEPDPAP